MRVLKWPDIDTAISAFTSILFFIMFSGPTEAKMGRRDMILLIAMVSVASVIVMRAFKQIRNANDIPVHRICSASGYACIWFLVSAANVPQKLFFIGTDVVIPKTFRWNAQEWDYAQVSYFAVFQVIFCAVFFFHF
jgi:hypothetical protein